MQELRVLVVDDESLIRRALTVFVSEADDIEVVGEAANGADALAAVASLAPDVVLMDAQMPVMGGAEATRIITRDHPATKVLALTTFGSLDAILPMLQAGAGGYLLKDSEPEDIVAALRDIARGLRVLSPAVASMLVASVSASVGVGQLVRLSDAERLTPRERAVVSLLARGLSNAEIARQQSVSEATVKSHLSNIMAKWDVRDRVQVLIRAARAGIITFE
ncbi:response regulator transcription factor [Microbacterium sp. cx-55]|uniref:response regulator n=1 Tax=unclassified Microbacterium TaxID=2609290 RepID=UPI001CC0B5A3|nr:MULTISPECIES: response regulator transcription factor [unclassified Microbacterium]MCC4907009.1 response regulator transcription factor [Microbacterium sp. cx-59]UGB34111.1 response regulator transcription factor [Microbacterium sp. cx-55]